MLGIRTKTFRGLATLLSAACAAGCASLPPPLEPVFARLAEKPDPAKVLAAFRARWPAKFTERQKALLDTPKGRIATLGVCSFDKAAGDFALALMTPAGFKLLQIQKHGDETTGAFRIPGASPDSKAARRIAEDGWLIYAHPDGPPSSRVVHPDRVSLVWCSRGKTVEMVFGRSPGSSELDLKIKTVADENGAECAIRYFKHRDFPDGTRRATAIEFENIRHNYRLSIKTIQPLSR